MEKKRKKTFFEKLKEIVIEGNQEYAKTMHRLGQEDNKEKMRTSLDYYRWRITTGRELTPQQKGDLEYLQFVLERPDRKKLN